MAERKYYTQVNLCGVIVQVSDFDSMSEGRSDGYHARTEGNPPLGEPTNEHPGTFAKLEVMRLRAQAGLAVTHPRDRVIEWEASTATRHTMYKIGSTARPRNAESWNNF